MAVRPLVGDEAGGRAMTACRVAAENRPITAELDAARSPEVVGPVASLVRVALGSDDAQQLVAGAAAALDQPLGLVAATGEALGHAPDDPRGRRALAVADAAARTALVTPPGWRVIRLSHPGSAPALLAIGGSDDRLGGCEPLVELVVTLLCEQLARMELRRRQTTDFVRRLVSGRRLDARRAREEGEALGLAVTDAYWPAVLALPAPARRAEIVEGIVRDASRAHRGRLTAMLEGHVVLLHPDGGGGVPALRWFEEIVERVRTRTPSLRFAQAVAADEVVALGEIGDHVSTLLRLSVLAPRAEGAPRVVRAGHFALDRLLWDNIGSDEARAFVDDRLGALLRWDGDHRSDLLRVLEAALDFPRHDQAASRCFMHRNTFRHRLRLATRILGDDLEDPDVRLALHVAIKLRRGLAAPAPRVVA